MPQCASFVSRIYRCTVHFRKPEGLGIRRFCINLYNDIILPLNPGIRNAGKQGILNFIISDVGGIIASIGDRLLLPPFRNDVRLLIIDILMSTIFRILGSRHSPFVWLSRECWAQLTPHSVHRLQGQQMGRPSATTLLRHLRFESLSSVTSTRSQPMRNADPAIFSEIGLL